MTTPTIALQVPIFNIFTDPITNAKSLQFDVNLKANLVGSPVSLLEVLQFGLRVSGFPTTGFTVPSNQSTWFTGVNSSLLPGLDLNDLGFTQTIPGVLNLNWAWYTSNGIIPQTDNKLFTVKIPLGNSDLSQSIFKLDALTPVEAVFDFDADVSASTLFTGATPTGALLLSTAAPATAANLTGGVWVKIDLTKSLASFPATTDWLTTTSSQVGITAPNVVATAPGSTTQSFYAYVKSNSATALDVSKLSFTLDAVNLPLTAGPNPVDLNYSDLYVAPKLTSITSKVGGVTAADGSDIDTALDVKANQNIEVTFTFSKSIKPESFNFEDLVFSGMAQQGSLTAVAGSNDKVFTALLDPSDTNTWNGSVGIKAGATITGSNNLPLDMTSMPASLQFAGDTAAPMTPSVQVEDIGVPDAGGGGSLSTDGVVNKVMLSSTGADYTNTQTINYYVDGATVPTASVSGSTAMSMNTTLNLADGVHTVRAQALDAAGNVSAFSTAINFTVDTKAPLVNLVESVSSIPGITTTPPSGQYFRVQFSENVIQVNPNDFRVLNADGSVNSTATITSVYRGTSGSTADTYTPEDDYYVVVNPSGQTTNLSVGVVPVVNISATTPYTGATPTGASLLSAATQADLTGGTWVKIDLNNPVASLPTSGAWITATSTQAGITAPYVVATAPGSTTQSFYAYVKSTPSGTALDVSKLNFTLQSNDAGGNAGSQSFGASITDIAGNSLLSDPMLDDQAAINASTPTLGLDATFITRPATGVGGFDTLNLSALSSAKPIDVVAEQGQIIVQGASSADTKVYRIENFDEFIISNASGVNFRGTMAASEVVQLTAPVSSNDIRLANRPQSDLSPETDIVDYSATSNAVDVNLGSTTNGGNGWFYATATKGALGVGGEDKIAGAEGIFGSSASDTITGGLRDNLLAGGDGNDTLDGAAGNDILVGGAGTGDILIGGTGKDILIDLDGATLTGSANKKGQGASGDQDVFVVGRTGSAISTINNFHVAKDGAGLAGRAATSANDTIVFNLSLGTLTANLHDLKTAVDVTKTLSASQLQVELAKIKKEIDIRVEKTTIAGDNTADDWVVIASYAGEWLATGQGSSVELARVIVKDMNATVIPANSDLEKVLLPDFSLENAVSEDIDQLVFSQVSDLLVKDDSINLAVALESVRQGTMRESKNGLMFGNFSLDERIFNPGVGSEKIFGSNKKDTYEFLVQDLKSNGSSTSDAGMDRILDTGGDDSVAFSNITRSQLNQLDFAAVKLGFETGHYSLSSNYSQSAGAITNQGGFSWTGHFRDGFDMELEQISLGDATLAMADVRYRYDEEGNILNWTPNQVALSGKDSIMVGGVGRSADASTFVVEKGVTFDTDIGADKTQHLYIWDVDANAVTGDVIDLKAFFGTKELAKAAVQNSVETNSFATNIKDSSSFKIDLDANNDLILNFMDINLTKESLDEMIVRAYMA